MATEHQRILIVEDDRDLSETLHELLCASGHEASVANDGEEALSELETFSPDVVLCDLGLPGSLTGLDVAREVRKQPRFDRVLLVALSGYARPEDKARCTEAGFDLHLTKPIDLASLEEALKAPR